MDLRKLGQSILEALARARGRTLSFLRLGAGPADVGPEVMPPPASPLADPLHRSRVLLIERIEKRLEALMPADLIRRGDGTFRIDLDWIFPPFLEKYLKLLDLCRQRGQLYYPTSGYRSFKEQSERNIAYVNYQLFLKGQGPKVPFAGKAVAAGLSAHNYGIAIDTAPDKDPAKPGLQADYSQARYNVLIEACRELGLVNGVHFGDSPHVQEPQFVSGKQLAKLRAIFLTAEGDDKAKLRACWDYLYSIPFFVA